MPRLELGTRLFTRRLRSTLTDAETALWRHVRRRQLGGHRFRRQHPVAGYIVDFVCLESRLILEIDGGQHDKQAGYDAQRDAFLEAQGFRVLRFWNNEVLGNMDGVLVAIAGALT